MGWHEELLSKLTGFVPEYEPKKKTGPKARSARDAYDYVMANAVRLENGCLNYTITKPIAFGYRYICVEGEAWYVHRLVFFVEHGYLPPVVRHSCDLPTCVEPLHLVAGTHTSNVADKVAKKRHGFGEKHYRSKLTQEQVIEIRSATGTYAELGRKYGISRGGIYNIKNGTSWKKENDS